MQVLRARAICFQTSYKLTATKKQANPGYPFDDKYFPYKVAYITDITILSVGALHSHALPRRRIAMASNVDILTRSHAIIKAKARAKRSQIDQIIFDDEARQSVFSYFPAYAWTQRSFAVNI